MFGRRSLRVSLRLSVVLALFAAAAYAGAPLKGVDVKLGKNPGGSPAARTTTDDEGHFDFGVLPKGNYTIALGLPGKSASTPAICTVEIRTANGETLRADWDFKQGKRVRDEKATARDAGGDLIPYVSDGEHPLNGAVVKSKSNISNN